MKHGGVLDKKLIQIRVKYVTPLLGMRRRLIDKWNEEAFPLEYSDLPPVSIDPDVFIAREQLR
jgi:hypothetical protein